MQGICDGFRIGFDYKHYSCKPAKENMHSAFKHPDVVRDNIAKEYALGRLLGPLDLQTLHGDQISRFGVIPEGTSDNWQMIVDLSLPKGHSVNDGIDLDLCSLTYISMDDAVRAILYMGRGTMLAKVDIKSAYRI